MRDEFLYEDVMEFENNCYLDDVWFPNTDYIELPYDDVWFPNTDDIELPYDDIWFPNTDDIREYSQQEFDRSDIELEVLNDMLQEGAWDDVTPVISEDTVEITTSDVFEDVSSLKGAAKYTALAQRVCSTYSCMVDSTDILFYDDETGCFERPSDKRKKQLIVSVLSPQELKTLSPRDGISNIVEKMWEILLVQSSNIDVPQAYNCKPNYINCLNGYIECVGSGVINLHAHSAKLARETRTDHCLDFNYIQNKTMRNTPVFDAYCLSTFKDEAIIAKKVLSQYMGYAFGNSMAGKCMLVLVGESNAGKSILMKFIEAIIPATHRSYVPLSDLNNPVKRGHLRGKKVNMQSELDSSKVKTIDVIKAATSGDTLSGDAKYLPLFEFMNTATFIIFTNKMPKMGDIDSTNGLFSRMRILHFPYSISKEAQNPNLLEELLAEKDAIVSNAVDAYADLLENNFVFAETDSSREYLKKYFETADPIRTFVQDELVVHSEAKVHSQRLWQTFSAYCDDNGVDNTAFLKEKLYERLDHMKGVRKSKFRMYSENKRGYVGIGLRIDFPTLIEKGDTNV